MSPTSELLQTYRPDELKLICMNNLLAATDERVYFKDLLSRFLFVSAGWVAAYAPGHTPEQLAGKTDFDVFSYEHAFAARQDEEQIIRTGQPIAGKLERETYLGRGGGWALSTKMPLRDERGQIIGTFGISRDVTAQLIDEKTAAEEQAALRRVATLVAKGAAPEDVFDAVATEMHMLLDADNTRLLRYEPDGTATVVASSSDPGLEIPVGTRDSLDGVNVAAAVRRTGSPARVDRIEGPPGSFADALRRLGLRSAAGAPVTLEGRLWGVMVAAWRQRLPVSGLEDRIGQFTELVATAISNAQARADLAASRARIVTASDLTRQRIERDLHDGAQQRLVSLALGLRSAGGTVPSGHAELKTELERAANELVEMLEELKELCRGIHPAILSTGGLGPALKGLARRSPVPVRLDVRVPGRLPDQIEMAAYFVVSEALANVAKHARASTIEVRLQAQDDTLQVLIRDDGIGGADPSLGSGLTGLTDRVEALGGTIDISSHVGTGTQVLVKLPAGGNQYPSADNSVTAAELVPPVDDGP